MESLFFSGKRRRKASARTISHAFELVTVWLFMMCFSLLTDSGWSCQTLMNSSIPLNHVTAASCARGLVSCTWNSIKEHTPRRRRWELIKEKKKRNIQTNKQTSSANSFIYIHCFRSNEEIAKVNSFFMTRNSWQLFLSFWEVTMRVSFFSFISSFPN